MTSAHDDRFGIPGYRVDTYGEAFADVYDEWYADLADDDFVAMMCTSLPDHPCRVLELGVGTGRLIEAWRRLRAPIVDEMTGIDSSASMLAVATSRLPDDVSLMHGDFSVDLPDGPFDVVFAGYNTFFNLPDDAAVTGCLAEVSRRLAPRGRLYLDVITAPVSGSGDDVSIKSMTPTEVVLSINRHDATSQRIEGQFVQFTHEGRTRLRPWAVRYLSPEQLDAMAADAGLGLTLRLGDGSGSAFDPEGPRHISCYVPFTPA